MFFYSGKSTIGNSWDAKFATNGCIRTIMSNEKYTIDDIDFEKLMERAKLSPRQREVIELRYGAEKRTKVSVAKQMKITPHCVAVYEWKAFEKLRRIILK